MKLLALTLIAVLALVAVVPSTFAHMDRDTYSIDFVYYLDDVKTTEDLKVGSTYDFTCEESNGKTIQSDYRFRMHMMYDHSPKGLDGYSYEQLVLPVSLTIDDSFVGEIMGVCELIDDEKHIWDESDILVIQYFSDVTSIIKPPVVTSYERDNTGIKINWERMTDPSVYYDIAHREYNSGSDFTIYEDRGVNFHSVKIDFPPEKYFEFKMRIDIDGGLEERSGDESEWTNTVIMSPYYEIVPVDDDLVVAEPIITHTRKNIKVNMSDLVIALGTDFKYKVKVSTECDTSLESNMNIYKTKWIDTSIQSEMYVISSDFKKGKDYGVTYKIQKPIGENRYFPTYCIESLGTVNPTDSQKKMRVTE